MARSRTIGLLGGMSWESTALYYRLLNTGMQRELGGHHNARSLLLTLDYDDLDTMASAGDWDGIAAALIDAARRVEGGGADFLMITAIPGTRSPRGSRPLSLSRFSMQPTSPAKSSGRRGIGGSVCSARASP
ncbi:Aspartate racemase [Devosia sp. DBB001]|nr:Aspartate racemase [Devosia sp. DBB001]